MAKITIDVSEWYFPDQERELDKLVEVTRTDFGIEISLRTDHTFDAIIKKASKEAIETFLGQEGAAVDITAEGISINCDEQSQAYIIPWERIYLMGGRKAYNAVTAWLNEEVRKSGGLE